MKTKILIACLILSLGSTGFVRAQDPGELNAIQYVVPFLLIAPDSRAGAMGDAGVATSPDMYSMHWNPAKYAYIDGNGGIGISYSPWLRTLVPDINIAYLAAYYRIDDKQVVSSSLLYSSLGDIPFTDDWGNVERTFKPNEFAFDAAYSRLLTDNFSGSIAFRFIYSNLTGGFPAGGTETKPGISFASDVSFYYRNDINIGRKDALISAGANISNIGAKMSYTDENDPDFIPMNLRLGPALKIRLDRYNDLNFAIDLNKLLVPTPPVYDEITGDIIAGKDPNVSVPVAIFQSFADAPGGFKEELHEISYSFGAEYWYNQQFAIRAGYFHEHASKGNRKYFTAGAGFRMSVFSLDFSYLMPLVNNHPLARTLRFSLSFDFKAFKNIKSAG
jgi:hypothetical protein